MKKMMLLLVIILLLLSFTACAGNPDITAIPTSIQQEPTQENTSTPLPTPTVEPKDMGFLQQVADRKTAILNSKTEVEYTGTAYYVSNSGDDSNDGKSPETAWATVEKVNKHTLQPGDAIFFERGGIWRGKVLFCQNGVTYSAYGDGDKPTITLSPEDGANAEKWSLFYEEPSGKKIWVYYKSLEDLGNIYFDQGKQWGNKISPKWINGMFVFSNKEPFDVKAGLIYDLDFFSEASSNLPKTGAVRLWENDNPGNWGPLYLRSDEGNPGELFKSIEFGSVGYTGSNRSNAVVRLADNSMVDNLRIVYGGNSGVGGSSTNSVVQNCEIAWVGGGVLTYNDNYMFSPEDGSVNVAGDGFALGGIGTVIKNNYVHDVFYDGITIEDASRGVISDMQVTGNLFEKNHVGIQMVYYNSDVNAPIFYHNITISNNFVVSSGYGWSTEQTNMRRGSGGQNATSLSFNDFTNPNDGIFITDNVFYDSRDVQVYGKMSGEYLPKLTGNTFYLQNKENDFAYWGENLDFYKANQAQEFLTTLFNSDTNKVVVLR